MGGMRNATAPPLSPTFPQAQTMPMPAARRTCSTCSRSRGTLLSPRVSAKTEELKDQSYPSSTPSQIAVFIVTTVIWWMTYYLCKAYHDHVQPAAE